jgi:hypothetical protein
MPLTAFNQKPSTPELLADDDIPLLRFVTIRCAGSIQTLMGGCIQFCFGGYKN